MICDGRKILTRGLPRRQKRLLRTGGPKIFMFAGLAQCKKAEGGWRSEEGTRADRAHEANQVDHEIKYSSARMFRPLIVSTEMNQQERQARAGQYHGKLVPTVLHSTEGTGKRKSLLARIELARAGRGDRREPTVNRASVVDG